MKTAFTYTTEAGNTLYADHYGADLPHDTPAIVYLHGFKGFKDWGFVPYMAENLVEAGFQVFTFNFSHNGVGQNFLEFDEPEKFTKNTFSLELTEAREFIESVKNGRLSTLEGVREVGVLGHSRGGGIALLASSNNPDVAATCTWAAVATFERYNDQIKRLWREQGHIEVTNSRTGQVFHLGVGLLEDLEAHKEGRLNIRKAVEVGESPLCIVHGDADQAVSVADARAIYDWANRNSVEMHIIRGTGHTFDAKHPFAGTTPYLEEALAHTRIFFAKQLGLG